MASPSVEIVDTYNGSAEQGEPGQAETAKPQGLGRRYLGMDIGKTMLSYMWFGGHNEWHSIANIRTTAIPGLEPADSSTNEPQRGAQ